MSEFSPLGAYVARASWLHSAPAGAKLIGLFVLAIAVVAVSDAWSTAVFLAIATASAVIAGLRGPDFWRVARGFALIGLPLFAFQWWQLGIVRAFETVGDLLTLILAASAVTASTRVEDMLDTISRALRPVARLWGDQTGLTSDRVALVFAMVIRTIPLLMEIAGETRQAARARGIERSPRARVVPLVLRTVAHAQATGDALTARGLAD